MQKTFKRAIAIFICVLAVLISGCNNNTVQFDEKKPYVTINMSISKDSQYPPLVRGLG